MSSRRTAKLADHNKSVGILLKLRRNELRMSQKELAAQLGLAFQQVQKYEKGVNAIPSGRLIQIANILEVSLEYFLHNNAETLPLHTPTGFGDIFSDENNLKMVSLVSRIKSSKTKAALIRLIENLADSEHNS